MAEQRTHRPNFVCSNISNVVFKILEKLAGNLLSSKRMTDAYKVIYFYILFYLLRIIAGAEIERNAQSNLRFKLAIIYSATNSNVVK